MELLPMSKCEYCKNKQVIQQGSRLLPCPYCMTEERLMRSIKRAVVDAKKEGNGDLAKKLQKVLDFLPDYSVLAIMEAEALNLNTSLIAMIREAFDILPFGDTTYKKNGMMVDKG